MRDDPGARIRKRGRPVRLHEALRSGSRWPGEYLRVPLTDYNHIRVGDDLPDDRYLFLSYILPTAWQGVEYAQVPEGGTLAVMGLGPVGQFVSRIALHRGYRVLAVEPEPARTAMAERHGVRTRPVMNTAGMDRLAAVYTSIDAVRRGGTVSLSGVYAGEADILPMKTMFDKQISLRMGQCNVKRWIDDVLPLVEDPADPLGVMDLATHHAPLSDAPQLYETFQKKADGCIKVVLTPA